MRKSRRALVASLSAAALGAAFPRQLAAQRVKRVAYVVQLLGKFEGDDPFGGDFARNYAREHLRDTSVQVVPHVVPIRGDYAAANDRGAREVADGKYDGAIVSNEDLARALAKAAPSLPIAASMWDPVSAGFAKTYARPGGKVTGAHSGAREVAIKQIEILRRIVPRASRVAWISYEPQFAVAWPAFEWAAKEAGVTARPVFIDYLVPGRPGVVQGFEALQRDGFECAHYHLGHAVDNGLIAELALKHRIALSVHTTASLNHDGLLFHYFSTRDHVHRALASAMAKILRGEPPGDIPFEGPTTYRMRLNMKTAVRLGLTIPADVELLAFHILR